jgi:hypothetical protein
MKKAREQSRAFFLDSFQEGLAAELKQKELIGFEIIHSRSCSNHLRLFSEGIWRPHRQQSRTTSTKRCEECTHIKEVEHSVPCKIGYRIARSECAEKRTHIKEVQRTITIEIR